MLSGAFEMTGPDDHPPDEPPSTLIIFTILAGCDDQPLELLELPLLPPRIPNVADAVQTQRARTTNT